MEKPNWIRARPVAERQKLDYIIKDGLQKEKLMSTEVEVRESLEEVLVPGVKRSLMVMNLVRHIAVSA